MVARFVLLGYTVLTRFIFFGLWLVAVIATGSAHAAACDWAERLTYTFFKRRNDS